MRKENRLAIALMVVTGAALVVGMAVVFLP